MGRAAWLFAVLLLGALAASQAMAHEVRPAYLQVAETEPGTFAVLWKQPILQDRRLPIDPIFPQACTPASPVVREVTGSALLQSWTIDCALDEGAIHISGLSRTITDVMVEISRADGGKSTHLLRPDAPSLNLSDPSPQVAAYLTLGVEHLVFGIDHVLFVVGLVLFIPSRWALLKTITAFTLAHSITLALSVLELVRLPQGPVEAVIALSILFLARELTMPEERRSALTRGRPWIMALLFGLLHGFGFAVRWPTSACPRPTGAVALPVQHRDRDRPDCNHRRTARSVVDRAAHRRKHRAGGKKRSCMPWAHWPPSGPSTGCCSSSELTGPAGRQRVCWRAGNRISMVTRCFPPRKSLDPAGSHPGGSGIARGVARPARNPRRLTSRSVRPR